MLEQERPNVKVGKGKDAQKLISIRKHNKVGGTPNIGYTFVNAHTHRPTNKHTFGDHNSANAIPFPSPRIQTLTQTHKAYAYRLEDWC